MDKANKISFLKDYIDNYGSNLTWAEYGERYGVHKDNIRRVWRLFKEEYYKRGEWLPNYQIDLEYKIKLKDIFDPLKDSPKGFKIQSIYEQQRDGEIIQLKSYKLDEDYDAALEVYNKLELKFESLVSKYEPHKIYVPKTQNEVPRRLAIYLSDTHVGSPGSELFDSKYSAEVFLNRINDILRFINKQYLIYGKFDQIALCHLGDSIDSIDGKTIRGTKLDSNMDEGDSFDVFFKGMTTICDHVITNEIANEVVYNQVANSNHPGIVEYIIGRGIEIYLKTKYPDNVKTQVNKNYLFHDNYGLWRFIYSHGKDSKHQKHAPLAMNLSPNGHKIITDYINYNGLEFGLDFKRAKTLIRVISGDQHQYLSTIKDRFSYVKLMSLVGDSNYTAHNYGASYRGFHYGIYERDSTTFHESYEMFY